MKRKESLITYLWNIEIEHLSFNYTRSRCKQSKMFIAVYGASYFHIVWIVAYGAHFLPCVTPSRPPRNTGLWM